MLRIMLRTTLFCLLLFSMTIVTAQVTNSKVSKQYPHLVLKVSYQNQLQAKVKAIQNKGNPAGKLPGTVIAPTVLKNINNAADFIAAYKTKNTIVGPMFLPSPYLTYLRIGEYSSGIPPFRDRVVSTLFNENEQSCLMSDKNFSNIALINSSLEKDVLAAWEIETADAAGYKISTTGTKKYLAVKRTGGSGTEKIILTSDKNDLSTNWIIYQGAEDGITFYNAAFNIFLGRRVQDRKIFLIPFSYKDYGNESLRKIITISWDLYFKTGSTYENENIYFDAFYRHSLRYMVSRPLKDADGDGHVSFVYGGTDCDDTDPTRYPGNTEICDPYGHDEDCNPTSPGTNDADGDGFISSTCFNIFNGVITSQGNDCDDNNAAIFPGVQIWASATQVDVCGAGLFDVEPGFVAVRQPNGTAIVIPKN